MDYKPKFNLEDSTPDPILEHKWAESNVNVPGKGKRFISFLIGLLVFIALLLVIAAAIYLMRDSMPEVLQEYIPEDIQIPYVN